MKPVVENRIREIKGILDKELTNLRYLKKKYSDVKRPVTKKKYAMMLVNSKKMVDYLNSSKSLMESNLERSMNAIEQSKSLGRLLYEQIKDARIYYEMSGQIRLVGQSLALVDSIHKKTSMFASELEVNMENLESALDEESEDNVLELADEILDNE